MSADPPAAGATDRRGRAVRSGRVRNASGPVAEATGRGGYGVTARPDRAPAVAHQSTLTLCEATEK
jgi:hypothetical protein